MLNTSHCQSTTQLIIFKVKWVCGLLPKLNLKQRFRRSWDFCTRLAFAIHEAATPLSFSWTLENSEWIPLITSWASPLAKNILNRPLIQHLFSCRVKAIAPYLTETRNRAQVSLLYKQFAWNTDVQRELPSVRVISCQRPKGANACLALRLQISGNMMLSTSPADYLASHQPK